MSKIRYTKDHEWVRQEDDGTFTVGITEFAQEQLGDIVFVEPPAVGSTLSAGDEAGVVESVKAASEIYAPLNGTVTAINEALEDEPALVNAQPLAAGWMFRMTLQNQADWESLMDDAAYAAHVAAQE